MMYGIQNKKVFFRHLLVSIFSLLLFYLFYLSYSAWGVQVALIPDWGADHPFWRAWAHAAFVLLFLALIISPAGTLWHPIKKLLSWRREFGIWFALLSVGHAYAIWDRWAQWDIGRLFGFEYIPELESYVLVRPEVGIMNMMGLVMAPMIILLAITSFDKVVKTLGVSSWKWLHSTLVHVIFYIAMLRGVLYLFYFFQTSPPNWRVYPPIWFLYVFLGMGIFAVLLQAGAFVKTVLHRSNHNEGRSVWQVIVVFIVAIIFATPLLLMTGTVAFFDNRAIKEPPASLAQQPRPSSPQDYAKNFEMIIYNEDQEIYLWAQNLDNSPNFRQTTKQSGEIISDKIYDSDKRILYMAELDVNKKLVWSKFENVRSEDVGIPGLVQGPGVWAKQYGEGEHMIEFPEGQLKVTIQSVGKVISDQMFDIPDNAEWVQTEQ